MGHIQKCTTALLMVLLFTMSATAMPLRQKTTFTLLQLNLWIECTKVEHAPQYLVEQIAALQPDVATFCELYKGPEDNPVVPYLIEQLKRQGITYYSARVDGRAVISKFPIEGSQRVNQWLCKVLLNIHGNKVTVYPAHSEYRYYTCYYPRGYNDGSTDWNKLPAPVTDVSKMIEVCDKSDRVASMQAFIDDATAERQKGHLVIMAGDLNEPSCLDWQCNTKDLFGHRGCIVDWSASKLLLNSGYKDAYRVKHPDAAKFPGFTFPAGNEDVAPDKLSWALEADERERIDFVYYYPDSRIKVKKAVIVGPSSSIVEGKRVKETSCDEFVEPLNGHWCSDHKGVLVTFIIK